MAETLDLITAHTGASHVSVDDKQALYMGIIGDHGEDETQPVRLWQPTMGEAVVTGSNSVQVPASVWCYHGWIVRVVSPVTLPVPPGTAGQSTSTYINVSIESGGGVQTAKVSCDRMRNTSTGGGYPSGFTPWVLTRNGLDAPTVVKSYLQSEPISAIMFPAHARLTLPMAMNPVTIARTGSLVTVDGFVDGWDKHGWADAPVWDSAIKIPVGYRPCWTGAVILVHTVNHAGDQAIFQVNPDGGIGLRGSTENLMHTAVVGSWITADPMPEA